MENVTSSDFNGIYPWITEEFFEKILRRDRKNNSITVTKYSIKAALAKGENYGSQMLRVTVNYDDDSHTEQSISFLIKTALTNPDMVKLTAETKLFEKEILAFQHILPQVEQLLQSIGETAKISAKCYDADINNSYLVFEDLSTSDYVNVDRRIGLDVAHFKQVLAKAAKWHAATAVLQSKKLIQLQSESIVETKSMKEMVINIIAATADAALQIPGYENLSTKLHALSKVIHQKVVSAAAIDDAEFNAICHGDMWSNNIMFRHDSDGNAIDAILVDFQIIFCAPSVLDVIAVMFTSSHADLRETDWDDLVQYYHAELVRLLTKLKYSKCVPTLAEIQASRIKRQMYSMPMAILGLAMRNFEKADADTVSKLIGSTDENHQFRVALVLNPKIRDNLVFLLSYFDKEGYFD